TGELCFRKIGHADDGIAEPFVGHALGIGGELRPFHADVGAAAHEPYSFGSCSRGDAVLQARRDRTCHGDVGAAALPEERARPIEGSVDELVDEDESARRQLLLEGAACGEGDQIGYPSALEHIDIGAIVDVGGREAVALVVTGEKYDRRPRYLSDAQCRRGVAPWASYSSQPRLLQSGQVVNPGAANDAEDRFRHSRSL